VLWRTGLGVTMAFAGSLPKVRTRPGALLSPPALNRVWQPRKVGEEHHEGQAPWILRGLGQD
jgi:hypothetical protein